MYGRLVTVTAVPGSRPTMEAVAEQLAPIYRSLKGFKGISFLIDEQANTYGSFSLWESKEAAEAVQKTAGARVQKAIARIATGPMRVQIFEVYEPQGCCSARARQRIPSLCPGTSGRRSLKAGAAPPSITHSALHGSWPLTE